MTTPILVGPGTVGMLLVLRSRPAPQALLVQRKLISHRIATHLVLLAAILPNVIGQRVMTR